MGNFHTVISLALAVLSTVVHAGNLVIRTGPVRQPSCVDFTPFVYAGCFEDVGSPRTLLYSSDLDRQTMTVEKCVAFCKGNGYKYAGLEYYGECYCGASVNAVQIEESNCNFPCNGNKTESCGGGKIISIYQDPTFKVISNSTVSDYMSMGCYSEGSNGRALGWRQDRVDSATLTVETCLSACLFGGYSFAGVEFGRECYCGVVLGNDTLPLDAVECDMRCTGDKTLFCGGRSKLNLYIAKHLEPTEPCGANGTISSSSSSSISLTSTFSIPPSLSSSSSDTTSSSLTTSSTSPPSSSILSTTSSTSSIPTSLGISSIEHPVSESSSLFTSSSTPTSSSSSGVLVTLITTSLESIRSSTTSDPPSSSSGTTSNAPSSPSTPSSSGTSPEIFATPFTTSAESSSSSIYYSSGTSATPVTTSAQSRSPSTELYTLSSSGGTASVESSTTTTSSASSTGYHSSQFPYTTTSRTPTPCTSTAYTSTASVTYASMSTSCTTTTSFEICTSYYTVYPPLPSPTCAYKLGKCCAIPIPEFTDKITCLKAFASCVAQIAICPVKAGFPELLRCNQFKDYCSRIADYCDDHCPGYKCTLSSCTQEIPPYGAPPMPTQGPGILRSSLYICPPFATPTPTTILTTPIITTATSSRQNYPTTTPPMPTHNNICTQPNDPTYGYPLGGYRIPNLSCNNEWVDYNNGHPFKLYTSPDTYKCPSYDPSGNNGPIQGCRDACDEQHRLCETGYAKLYNGNDYLSACQRCSKQRDECYFQNKDVSGGGNCESFN